MRWWWLDWEKLKDEYINTSISYQKLAEKYGVSFWALSKRGKEEKWFDQKITTSHSENVGSGKNKNFIPINQRPKEEQKALRRKGQQKRKENFEKKLTSKECAKLILDLGIKDEKAKKALVSMGINEKDLQNRMLMIFSLFQTSVKTGDPNKIKSFLEIAGELEGQQELEKPVININVSEAKIEDID